MIDITNDWVFKSELGSRHLNIQSAWAQDQLWDKILKVYLIPTVQIKPYNKLVRILFMARNK